MWIKVNEKKYFYQSNVKDIAECLIYDGNESWFETETIENILQRAKEQNKRIKYDDDTIKETIESGEPNNVEWVQGDEDSSSCQLKLKYTVKSCPFNFTWHLHRQHEHEFHKFILSPMFKIVHGLTQQNNELREMVRKKDIEIKQYKQEFPFPLKRTTVLTKPVDFDDFDKRYKEVSVHSKNVLEIFDLFKTKIPIENGGNVENVTINKNVKLTPRRKRRQLLQEKQRVFEKIVSRRKKPLRYENSQSQASSNSYSDTEVQTKKSLKPLKTAAPFKIINDLDEPVPTAEPEPEKVKPDLELSNENSPKKVAEDDSPSKALKLHFNDESDNSEDFDSFAEQKPTTSKNAQIRTRSRKRLFTKDDNFPGKLVRTNAKISPNSIDSGEKELFSSTNEKKKDDITELINEWKELEKQRIEDLEKSVINYKKKF